MVLVLPDCKTTVLKFKCSRIACGDLLNTEIPGPCLELFWFRRSGVEPRDLYLNKYPTLIEVARTRACSICYKI